MEDRIKKLTSWGFPIAVIAAISFLSVAFMNRDGLGDPQKFASQFSSLKPFFASVSLGNLSEPAQLSSANVEPGSTNAGNPPSVSVPTSTPAPGRHISLPPENPATPPVVITPPPAVITTPPLTNVTPPAGPPDLAITIIDTGILDANSVFVHAAQVEAGQKGAVVFEVKNIGGSSSTDWIFNAKIPIPDSNFTSMTQSALAPGEIIRFTMAFSNLLERATNTVSFVVDPDSRVSKDPNRANNVAATTLYRNY